MTDHCQGRLRVSLVTTEPSHMPSLPVTRRLAVQLPAHMVHRTLTTPGAWQNCAGIAEWLSAIVDEVTGVLNLLDRS
jgi:hypothetical protein